MATSYFRERARNPYLRQRVAPTFEDDPNISPTFSRPMPMAPEVVERPPLRAETPATPALAPPDPIETARTAYEAGAPTTVGGRFKQAGLNALLGFLQAASRDRENPLAAGLGGAAAGGAISAISPKTGRGYQFETIQRPGIEDRLRRDDERLKRAQGQEDRARAIRLDEAKIKDIESEAQVRLHPSPKAVSPLRGRAGDVFLDPVTKQPIARIPQQEKPPSAAELTIDPESGMSAEEMADASYQGRGGDRYVFSHLPAPARQLIEKGTFTQDGQEYPASPEQVAAAQRALDDAIKRQRDTDLQYTRGAIRSKRLGGGRQEPKPSGSQSGISRPRSQFNSSKFPGLKFD